jgi:hypothetical protein
VYTAIAKNQVKSEFRRQSLKSFKVLSSGTENELPVSNTDTEIEDNRILRGV